MKTLEERQKACADEVNKVLEKHGFNLVPQVQPIMVLQEKEKKPENKVAV